MKDGLKTFKKLEQGDQATIFCIAREALNDKGMLEYMYISKEYAKQLKDNLDKIIDELITC